LPTPALALSKLAVPPVHNTTSRAGGGSKGLTLQLESVAVGLPSYVLFITIAVGDTGFWVMVAVVVADVLLRT
jgi:hypothetical protein